LPQIIVTADRPNERGEGPVMLNERVSAADFESEHFAARLVERLGWAVTDADEAERLGWAVTDADEAERQAVTKARRRHDE
jgi:hypothetical protein